MDRNLLVGIAIGTFFGFLVAPQIALALYSIPPTNAWRTIAVDYNSTEPEQGDTSVNAISYRDTLYLISDGSILFNITKFTP